MGKSLTPVLGMSKQEAGTVVAAKYPNECHC